MDSLLIINLRITIQGLEDDIKCIQYDLDNNLISFISQAVLSEELNKLKVELQYSKKELEKLLK